MIVPTPPPPPRRKWLNIVFDLNGILCHTAFRSTRVGQRSYKLEDNVLCHQIPTVVGPKVVFARPNLGEFLRQVFAMADNVLVWTSMQKRNADAIVGHLFRGTQAPDAILSQEQCTKIELSPGRFFHVGHKLMCMKVLSETLFTNRTGDTFFSSGNTLLIDDSPIKSICNENGNAVFLRTWNPHVGEDDFLLGELLPWLRGLDSRCQAGELRRYVEANRIGVNPSSVGDLAVDDLIARMRESSKNMGTRFNLPGLGMVVEGGRIRSRSLVRA